MKRALNGFYLFFWCWPYCWGRPGFSALPAGNCHWDSNRMGQPRSGVRPLFQGHPVLRLGLPAVGQDPELAIALADAYKAAGNYTKAEYTLANAIAAGAPSLSTKPCVRPM